MIFITSLLPSLKSPTLGIKLQVCITNYAVTAGFFLSTQKPTCLKLKHPSVPRFLALHRKQTTAIPVLELITLVNYTVIHREYRNYEPICRH